MGCRSARHGAPRPLSFVPIVIPHLGGEPNDPGRRPIKGMGASSSGRIRSLGAANDYRVSGKAGDALTVELVSCSGEYLTDPVIAAIELYLENRAGHLELVARSRQSFDVFDPVIMDVILPKDAIYRIRVSAPDIIHLPWDLTPFSLTANGLEDFRRGDYELFVYRFFGGSAFIQAHKRVRMIQPLAGLKQRSEMW